MMYARTGLGQLGDAQRAALIETGVATGLQTAAMIDPEPISKAVLFAASMLVGLVGRLFHGCGQTCVLATQVVDQIEPALKANLDAYLNGPRTIADQTAALNAFDYAWSQVVQACSSPQLGDAGKRCISERGPGGRPSWGKNWFELYRDPIAHDVAKAPATIAAAAESVLSNPDLVLNSAYYTWLVPVGLLVAGALA